VNDAERGWSREQEETVGIGTSHFSANKPDFPHPEGCAGARRGCTGHREWEPQAGPSSPGPLA